MGTFFPTLFGFCATVAVILSVHAIAQAQVSPIGGQFQVNSNTTGFHYYVSVGMAPSGEFTVSWTRSDNGPHTIQGRRFGSGATPAGTDFQINSDSARGAQRSAIGVDSSGASTVVWEGQTFVGFAYSIIGRRFDADGMSVGTEFQVGSGTTTRGGSDVALAMGPAGDFIVVWHGSTSSGSDSDRGSIQAQRFASDGLPVGGQFQVNTYTTGGQYGPVVARALDGSFMVGWSDIFPGGSVVRGQNFGSNGLPLGPELLLRSGVNNISPAVSASSNGEFMVVSSVGLGGVDDEASEVRGRRFSKTGSPLGTEFQVNTYTTGTQRSVSVTHGPTGESVVVWHSEGSSGTDNDRSSIQGQVFGSDGAPIGTEFQVNTYTTGYQTCPAVAFGSNNTFVVVWASDVFFFVPFFDETASVQGQRFALVMPGSECGNPVSGQLASTLTATSSLVTASDALALLRAAVGSFACPLCVCDVDNSGVVTATDALLVLRLAVGQPVVLTCPTCD